MPSGGHARSGPAPVPNSGRSDARGLKFTALPAQGFTGPIPDFPLPARTVYRWEYEDKRRFQVLDLDATKVVTDRELQLWEWAWRTPQACAWSKPSESWRVTSVAMWVRTFVICEGDSATAADKGSLHRFADDIGLSPAGLRQNGWAVAADELSERAAAAEPEKPKSSRDRMKVVGGSGR